MLHRRRPRASALAFVVAIVALAALFGPAAVFAQAPSLTVQLTGMTGDAWPQGQAFVTVLGADGRPLPGLTANDVHASIDGTDVPVGAVSQSVNSGAPIDVVLALDVSGSMNEGGAIDQAKAAAHTFIDQLAPQDRIAIVAFGTTVENALPFTQDRAAANAAIDGLVADGSTALFQGTVDSIRLAASGENGRRAVVLLSDGLDFGSSISLEAAIATGQAGGVPVFAIGLGEELDRAYLGQLAEATGGQFAETPSPEGLAALYQQVGELLRGQYIITLDASALDIERSQPINLHLDVTQNGLTGSDERAVCPQSVCVAISGIAEGAQIDGQQTVQAQVVAAEAVTSVALVIDGETIVTLVAPPYTFTIDGASLQDGDHNVVVEAKTASSSASTPDLSVHVGVVASSGGATSGLLPIVAMAGAGVLVVAVILFVLRRRRGRHPQPAAPIGPEPEPPAASPEPFDSSPRPRTGRLWPDEPDVAVQPATAHQALGTLLMTEGEMTGQSWPLGSAPISIGTGHRCLIRVAQIGFDDIANEHARVWVREDHLVLHELRRLTAFGPTGGRWAFLNAGDSFAVGPHVFQFQLAAQAAPEPPSEARALPEIRPGPGSQPPEQEPATVGQSSQQAPATAEPSTAKTGEPPAAGSEPPFDPSTAKTGEPPAAGSEPPLPAPQVATPEEPAVAASLPPTFEPSPFAATPAQAEREVSDTADVPNILREHKPDEASPPAPSQGEPDSGVPNILRERPAEAPADKKGEDAA
ncbi:MAG: VWA domain-containing protein [Dehalococcoidia bacterium]